MKEPEESNAARALCFNLGDGHSGRRWVAEHQDFEEGRYFSDVQVSGPFAYWKHTHTFEPDGPTACFLEDRVEYALPFGVLGRWFAGWYVRRKLTKLFEYRHEVTARELKWRRPQPDIIRPC